MQADPPRHLRHFRDFRDQSRRIAVPTSSHHGPVCVGIDWVVVGNRFDDISWWRNVNGWNVGWSRGSRGYGRPLDGLGVGQHCPRPSFWTSVHGQWTMDCAQWTMRFTLRFF